MIIRVYLEPNVVQKTSLSFVDAETDIDELKVLTITKDGVEVAVFKEWCYLTRGV